MDAALPPSSALHQLVNHSPELMALYDSDRRYVALSPSLATVLAPGTASPIGQTNAELATQTQGANQSKPWRKYWQQVADAIDTVFQRGQAERRIHALPVGAGLQLYETTYTPITNQDGHIEQLVSISRVAVTSDDPLPKGAKTLTDAQLVHYPDSIVGAEMPRLESASLADLAAIAPTVPPDAPPLPAAIAALPTAIDPVHQTAEFMQVVLDNIPQYIFWKDRQSVYLGCNRRWAEMAGFTDPSDVVGITDAQLPWTSDQVDWYLECDRRVMETDTPMLRIKESQLQADGTLSWRETNKLPLHDEQGNVVGLLG
ncbi:MAG TPA: PAS domain-containing protein, partial [Candidatus Obscuribacterales bacterium]